MMGMVFLKTNALFFLKDNNHLFEDIFSRLTVTSWDFDSNNDNKPVG